MTTKTYVLIIIACLGISIHAIAQNTSVTSVTQTTSSQNNGKNMHFPAGIDFLHKGEPISPQMLMPLFPDLQDSASQTVIDLNRGALYQASFDTVWSHSLSWLKPLQRKSAYTSIMDFGFISYIVLGKAAPNRYVLFGCIDAGDGSPTRYYVFVVDKEGDKLVKTGGFRTDNSRASAIMLQGNTIMDHNKAYMIPAEKQK